MSTAQEGLDTAKTGIGAIALALVQGQAAPAVARTQVGDGLTKAQTALNSVNSLVVSFSFYALGLTS